MDTFEAIENRRSIKHYNTSHHMTDDEIKKLMSYTMLSPTAFNIQHVRYVLVKDQELRKKIREASWDQEQVTDASVLIIICGDLNAWEKNPERYWKNAPEKVRHSLVSMILNYYKGKEQFQRDEVMRSCGMAAQTLMLAAKAMGYDTCPMDGFEFDKVAQLIHLPKDHIISMFITVGKGAKEARPRAGQLSMDEVVIHDSF